MADNSYSQVEAEVAGAVDPVRNVSQAPLNVFSHCRPQAPIEATSEQSVTEKLLGAGLTVEQLAGGNGDRAPEIADLVRRPARGGAGKAGDLS